MQPVDHLISHITAKAALQQDTNLYSVDVFSHDGLGNFTMAGDTNMPMHISTSVHQVGDFACGLLDHSMRCSTVVLLQAL